MPLGISESLIQRAYAPVDWSNFYKGVSDIEKRSLAEIAAERRLAQKQFYTDYASISKPQKGVREQDLPDILQETNVFKENGLPLANNPRYIEKNKDDYGKKASARDKAAENVLSKSASSIEVANQGKMLSKRILDEMSSGKGNWKSTAFDELQQNLKKKSSEIIDQNLLDISNYQEQSLSKSERDEINKRLGDKENSTTGRIYTETGDFGRYNEYKVPNLNKISITVDNIVKNIPLNKIKAEINSDPNYYENVEKTYNDIPHDNFKKISLDKNTPYFTPHPMPNGALNADGTPMMTQKPVLKFDKSNPKAYYHDILVANEFNKNIPGTNATSGPKDDIEYKTKIEFTQQNKKEFADFTKRLERVNIKFRAQTGQDMKASDVNQYLEQHKSDQKLYNSLTTTAFRESFGKGENKGKGAVAQLIEFNKKLNEARGILDEPSMKQPSPKPKSDKKFF